MASTQHPKAVTPANPLAARSQGYGIEPSSSIKADANDDILVCLLIWILPALFLAGIIVLSTMLISHTVVMRIPLPRLFALIIVITFAVLITITFFLLMAFHFRRSQRRIRFQRVRFTLSETSSLAGKSVPGARRFSHSSEFSQISLLNVEAAVVSISEPTFAQNMPEVPLRRVKCHANIKQAAQDQDSNKAPVARESTRSLPDSARVLPSSSHSSFENNTLSDNQWPLRPSPLQRLLAISPATASGAQPNQTCIF